MEPLMECPAPVSSDNRTWINFDPLSLFEAFLVGLTVLTVFYLMVKAFGKIKDLCKQALTISIELSAPLNQGSALYAYLLEWLTENISDSQCHTELVSKCTQEEDGKMVTLLKRNIRFGKSDFKYQNRWFRVERVRMPEVLANFTSHESITLTTYRWNASIVQDILDQVKTKFRIEHEDKTQFYFAENGYWNTFGNAKKKRPVATVILSEATENRLLDDIKDFLASEDWYSERGIPYRRGYLLHGPPGCGKSSLIKAIAGELSYDVCMMSLSSPTLTDDTLNALMNRTPDKCIVVMEDIDAAFVTRETQKKPVMENETDELCLKSNPAYGGTNSVTFSGLLNTLDGVASTEGRIIILTTNYLDRLDPALARPGRVDLKLLVDYPTDDQLKRMFTRFYKDSDQELAEKFVSVIRDLVKPVSMAACQGLFMMYKNSPEDALKGANEYFDEQFFAVDPIIVPLNIPSGGRLALTQKA